jgi:hypothetical protein
MSNTYETSLIQLRFIGDDLKERSVPIYQLAHALIDLQVMVNKAHLVRLGLHAHRPYLDTSSREKLALQICDRKKASDGYGLIPLITSPEVTDCVSYVFNALRMYATQRVLDPKGPRESKEEHIFTALVYNQARDFHTRVNPKNGIDSIEINSALLSGEEPVKILAENKGYVNSLNNQNSLGPEMVLRGSVMNIDAQHSAIRVKREEGGIITVFLKPFDYEQIRFSKIKNPRIEAIGHPILKLGRESYNYTGFEASAMAITGESNNNL